MDVWRTDARDKWSRWVNIHSTEIDAQIPSIKALGFKKKKKQMTCFDFVVEA